MKQEFGEQYPKRKTDVRMQTVSQLFNVSKVQAMTVKERQKHED